MSAAFPKGLFAADDFRQCERNPSVSLHPREA